MIREDERCEFCKYKKTLYIPPMTLGAHKERRLTTLLADVQEYLPCCIALLADECVMLLPDEDGTCEMFMQKEPVNEDN